MKKEFGKHYLVEFVDCRAACLNEVKDVKPILLKAAKASGATILKSFFHQFKPAGVTGLIMIAESHFSLHTWPEDRYAAFDILTCGIMKPQLAVEFLQKAFQAGKVKTKVISRGF